MIKGTNKPINGLTVGATYAMFIETRASVTQQIESGAEIIQKIRMTETESSGNNMYYYDVYLFKATNSTVTIHSSTTWNVYLRVK